MNEVAGNIILERTFRFALKIVGLCRWLQQEKKEYVLSKQLLRSGTSIGANSREAQEAESRADFIHKFSIANKESIETNYWLELMEASELILDYPDYRKLMDEGKEIKNILTSIIRSSKGIGKS
jgi:four helix bundle protein